MESIPSRVEAVLVLRISDINLMKHEALIAPVSLSQQERGPLLSSQSLNSFNCSEESKYRRIEGQRNRRPWWWVSIGGLFRSFLCHEEHEKTERRWWFRSVVVLNLSFEWWWFRSVEDRWWFEGSVEDWWRISGGFDR
ncbi:unnamed protein product [Brassica oleracea]